MSAAPASLWWCCRRWRRWHRRRLQRRRRRWRRGEPIQSLCNPPQSHRNPSHLDQETYNPSTILVSSLRSCKNLDSMIASFGFSQKSMWFGRTSIVPPSLQGHLWILCLLALAHPRGCTLAVLISMEAFRVIVLFVSQTRSNSFWGGVGWGGEFFVVVWDGCWKNVSIENRSLCSRGRGPKGMIWDHSLMTWLSQEFTNSWKSSFRLFPVTRFCDMGDNKLLTICSHISVLSKPPQSPYVTKNKNGVGWGVVEFPIESQTWLAFGVPTRSKNASGCWGGLLPRATPIGCPQASLA